MKEMANSYNSIQQRIDQQLAEIDTVNQQVQKEEEEAQLAQQHAGQKDKFKICTLLTNPFKRMKRLLFIIGVLMAMTTGTWAQSHWTYTPPGGQSENTVVYAKLNLGTLEAAPNYQNYEVAAFVDGELRAVATAKANPAISTHADYNYFELNIKGNFDQDAKEDNGKAITFKMYNSSTGAEYDLTSAAITFDGKLHGTPSSLFELSASEVTGLWIDSPIYITKGTTLDLTPYVHPIPETATLPNNIVWGVDDQYADIVSVTEAGILSVVNVPNPYRSAYVRAKFGGSAQWQAEAVVLVINHATSMSVKEVYQNITVSVNDSETLQNALANALVVEPEDYTDVIVWTSGDESIIQDGGKGTDWTPIAKGQTTMTATITYDTTTLTATINVTVVQPVEAIELTTKNVLECNVGDVLTDFVKTFYRVMPDDATNPAVTYSLGSGSTSGLLTISGQAITAAAAGTGTLVVTSAENPNIYAEIPVRVHNYAKEVALDRSQQFFTYRGTAIDFTDMLYGNMPTLAGFLTITPNGYTEILGISITSSNEDVVKATLSPLTGAVGITGSATVVGAGESTLTITLQYPDFLNIDATTGQPTRKTSVATMTIIVSQGVESVTANTSSIELMPGDVLNATQLASLYTLSPASAEDATVTYSLLTNDASGAPTETGIVELTNGGTALRALKEGVAYLNIVSNDNPQASCTITVRVVNYAKEATAAAENLYVKFFGQTVDISDQMKGNITLTPAGAYIYDLSIASSDPTVVYIDPIKPGGTDYPLYAEARKVGESTITVTLTYPNTLANLTGTGTGYQTLTSTCSFKVIVSEGLTGFEVICSDEMGVSLGESVDLIPQPAGADFDLSLLSIEAVTDVAWPVASLATPYTYDSNGVTVISANITLLTPGNFTLHITYDGQQVANKAVSVYVPTALSQGWQWYTPWGDISKNDFATHFDDAQIDEIRSQDALMANDPEYGYFGELYESGLTHATAYKINARKAMPGSSLRRQYENVLSDGKDVTLRKAWTWMGNPYVNTYNLSALSLDASDGDRIVSKNDGFAEFNGTAWTGSLTQLKPYEAYLYYNNSDSERTLMLLSEGNAWQAQQASGSRMNAPAARPAVGSWQYDASRFRDNMSMVARLEGVADSERYTVGAFVDNECRGEGRCYDGLMFITVHANQGEQVSFRLEDSYSGQQYDVEETTTMTLMRGSLKQPFTLTSLGVTTGISSMQNAPATDAQHYDLGGRTVNSGNAKGLTIERRADGTVRKVVK